MKKILAFHLPQFHSIPENSHIGPTGTEWDRVRPASSSMSWNAPPIRKPMDDAIGYYDLLDVEVRRNQAVLARRHGVDGFCYYHYWMSGRKLLEAPLETMLSDGQPDIPFCLAWANETWTTAGYGDEDREIAAQTYGGLEEWDQHVECLLRYFDHPNYIEVDGKPMLLVYKLADIPCVRERFKHYRDRVRRSGRTGLWVVQMMGAEPSTRVPMTDVANAVCEFQPGYLTRTKFEFRMEGEVAVISYPNACKAIPTGTKVYPNHYRGVFSGFDNTPRLGNRRATVYDDVRPDDFCECLKRQLENTAEDGFVFVNAFNEWAEGAILEPDDRWGDSFLRAVAEARR